MNAEQIESAVVDASAAALTLLNERLEEPAIVTAAMAKAAGLLAADAAVSLSRNGGVPLESAIQELTGKVTQYARHLARSIDARRRGFN